MYISLLRYNCKPTTKQNYTLLGGYKVNRQTAPSIGKDVKKLVGVENVHFPGRTYIKCTAALDNNHNEFLKMLKVLIGIYQR